MKLYCSLCKALTIEVEKGAVKKGTTTICKACGENLGVRKDPQAYELPDFMKSLGLGFRSR
jgi:hypothetical protein